MRRLRLAYFVPCVPHVFDNQMLAQVSYFGFSIGEVSCPTKYFAEASSINLKRSIVYGLGVLWTSISFRLHKMGLLHSRRFDSGGARLDVSTAQTV